MAKDKIAVSKIVLKLDGKEVELTIKQAMELKKLLNDTFPDKVVKEYIPYPVTPTPPYIPYKPIKEKPTAIIPYVPFKPTKPYPVSRPYKAPPISYLAPYKPYETFTIKTTTE